MENYFDFYEIQLEKFDQLDEIQITTKKNIPNFLKISD